MHICTSYCMCDVGSRYHLQLGSFSRPIDRVSRVSWESQNAALMLPRRLLLQTETMTFVLDDFEKLNNDGKMHWNELTMKNRENVSWKHEAQRAFVNDEMELNNKTQHEHEDALRAVVRRLLQPDGSDGRVLHVRNVSTRDKNSNDANSVHARNADIVIAATSSPQEVVLFRHERRSGNSSTHKAEPGQLTVVHRFRVCFSEAIDAFALSDCGRRLCVVSRTEIAVWTFSYNQKHVHLAAMMPAS